MAHSLTSCVLALAVGVSAVPVLAQDGLFTISIESSANSTTVSPGQPINWQVRLTGDNVTLGLAGFTFDLVQASSNPSFIDIPPASGVPTLMAGFSRPAGISNPAVGSSPGYCGTPVGTPGNKNLLEVGGLQNTYGASGGVFGQDFTVDGGIGLGMGTIVASGTFFAPSAQGSYAFQIQNAVVNALFQINSPPAASVALPVDVVVENNLVFTVVASACDPDVNQDGNADSGDVSYLIGVIAGEPNPVGIDPDFNRDGNADSGDIDALVNVIAGGLCP